MGFGLVGRDFEDKAIDLMIGQKKSATESARVLRDMGYVVTASQLRRVKIKAFESLVEDQRQEAMADFLLESINKVIFSFEEIYERYSDLLDKLEKEGRLGEQVLVLREMKSMLNMSLKRLGEYHSGIEKITAKNVNIISGDDMIKALRGQQRRWFDEMEPEMKDGKLFFNKPLPEVIDEYNKWKFKNNSVNKSILLPESVSVRE